MKKTNLTRIILLLMLLCLIGLSGKNTTIYAAESDFQVDPSGVLQSYTGAGGKVTLPKSVKTISSRAFSGNTAITGIYMPDTVRTIENGAFDSCYFLKEVDLSNKLTTIGDNAFWGCTSLSRISIPKSVTTIGFGAFGHCDSLKSIYIPKSVSSIGNYAFGFVYYGDFSPLTDFMLIGEKGSAADQYARKYDFPLITKSMLKTSLKKISSTNNQYKITWDKNRNVSGYEIQISTDKKFSKAKTQTILVKKYTKMNYLYKAAKGKTYYVRIRGYKNAAGEKYFSSWSKVKSFHSSK